MALKPDRSYDESVDLSYFWSESQTQVEKGGVASIENYAASGFSLDASGFVANYDADGSGCVPLGVLLQDVNPPLSTTRDYKNFHNNEIRPGEKCTLLRKGWVVTDMIVSGISPSPGNDAFLGASGKLTTDGAVASGNLLVGRFESTKDSDGFARVYIDI